MKTYGQLLALIALSLLATASPSLGEVDVSAGGQIFYTVSNGAGHTTVSSTHLARLRGWGPGDGSNHMALRGLVYGPTHKLHDKFVRDSLNIANTAGTLFDSSFYIQGACAFLEGQYSGRTDGGYTPPFLPGIFFVTDTTPLGITVINCVPLLPCETLLSSTLTTSLDFSSATTDESLQMDFALGRSEVRGAESFIMDEWALIEGQRVTRASSEAFRRAAQRIKGHERLSLLVQEPNHLQNSRHIPKPQLEVMDSRLPVSWSGGNATAVVRLEFTKENLVDHSEVIYSSGTVNEAWLAEHVSQRLTLRFLTERRHRVVAYALIHLDDELRLAQSILTLPQCCCGEYQC